MNYELHRNCTNCAIMSRIRLSVIIVHVEDIIADLAQAFEKVAHLSVKNKATENDSDKGKGFFAFQKKQQVISLILVFFKLKPRNIVPGL